MTTQRKGMVLALTGRAGSGKNTVAEILKHYLGDEFVIVCEGFADSLKLSAARALGFDPETTADAIALIDDLKTGGFVVTERGTIDMRRSVTGREFLQRYGTESHRDVFGYDFWVDQVIPPGGFMAPDFDLKIVTDLRFENEAARVRAVAGEIWRVDRTQDGAEDVHVSEAGIADVDRVIHNDGDLLHLDDTIRGLADDLRHALACHRPEATGFPGPTHMETASGVYFDILRPRAEDVRLEDIAHHLARINRYTGATGREISVGEHTMLVADRLFLLGYPPAVVLRGLHHDSHEAYTGDIGRPMKIALERAAPGLVKRIEQEIDAVIHDALRLPQLDGPELVAIKEADEWALSAESWHHMPSKGSDWTSRGLFDASAPVDISALWRLPEDRAPDAKTVSNIWLLIHRRLAREVEGVAA